MKRTLLSGLLAIGLFYGCHEKQVQPTRSNSTFETMGDWQIFPPWTAKQGPTDISLGSLIRDDFDVVNHDNEYEIMTSLEWTGLSRQEVANLRNLTSSKELEDFLRPHNCGISTGIEVDMGSGEDPRDAKFGLTLSTKEGISQTLMNDIVDFVRHYKVH